MLGRRNTNDAVAITTHITIEEQEDSEPAVDVANDNNNLDNDAGQC